MNTGEGPNFNAMRPNKGVVIVLSDKIVYLHVGVFLSGKDRLVSEIGNKVTILNIFVGY